MEDLEKDEQKALIKEAFREWLDEKFAEFGKWSARSIGAAVFGAVLVYLVKHGWIR